MPLDRRQYNNDSESVLKELEGWKYSERGEKKTKIDPEIGRLGETHANVKE